MGLLGRLPPAIRHPTIRSRERPTAVMIDGGEKTNIRSVQLWLKWIPIKSVIAHRDMHQSNYTHTSETNGNRVFYIKEKREAFMTHLFEAAPWTRCREKERPFWVDRGESLSEHEDASIFEYDHTYKGKCFLWINLDKREKSNDLYAVKKFVTPLRIVAFRG